MSRTMRTTIAIAGRLVAMVGIVVGVLLLSGSQPVSADTHPPLVFVFPVGPPVAQEGIRVQWSYQGTGVYWFVIERENPARQWISEQFNGYIDDASVERGREYRYRVCAVYLTYSSCSRWIGATVPNPNPNPNPNAPNPSPGGRPLPAEVANPVLQATPHTGGSVYLKWELPPSGSVALTRGALYRDDRTTGSIYEALQPGSFDSDYVDNVRPNSRHAYMFCFEGPAFGERCSDWVWSGPKPLPPTAPVGVTLTVQNQKYDPPATLEVRWRWSSDHIPGNYITVEREDEYLIPGGRTPDGIILAPRRELGWNEQTRISVDTYPNGPTTVTFTEEATGPLPVRDSTRGIGHRFRVCALVPVLGEAGKACSEPVTRPAALDPGIDFGSCPGAPGPCHSKPNPALELDVHIEALPQNVCVLSAGGCPDSERRDDSGTTAGTTMTRPVLRQGSSGSAVEELQTRLRRHGHPVTVDGIFGPQTDAAVRAFQAAKGLVVDGVVGPQTWDALLQPPARIRIFDE